MKNENYKSLEVTYVQKKKESQTTKIPCKRI